jgi:hypothetical protein
VVDGLEKPTDVGIEHPAHLLRQKPGVERIQRLMRTALRPEPVSSPKTVASGNCRYPGPATLSRRRRKRRT